MITRRLLLTAAALAALYTPAMAQDAEFNFGVIATEASQTARPLWAPFVADMEKATGLKVRAFFAPDYAGIIEGMRFKKVQVAWYGNAAAIQAVDRANGEVFAQVTRSDGEPGYWSLLIVNKDSPIKTFEDLLKKPGQYTFGNGDPNSTSGFLIPSYYAWALNNVDIRQHFTRIISGNHEANALAVANKQVDVATNNTEDLLRVQRNSPDRAAMIREIWRSPLIANDPIVWRADLDKPTKDKITGFMFAYGTPQAGKSEAEVEREKKVLAGLLWGPFVPSTNKQLIPIRKISLFRDKTKIAGDENMAAAEKQAKIAEIDAKLAELDKAGS